MHLDAFGVHLGKDDDTINKARKILGFNPKTDWKEALSLTLDWYVSYYNKNPKKRFFEGPNKFYK